MTVIQRIAVECRVVVEMTVTTNVTIGKYRDNAYNREGLNMSYFTDFVRILDLGATVILPVVIFLLGLFFRQKIGAAFRSGLTIGVAL